MISKRKYQEFLELVIAGKSLPEKSTEEEKKKFEELLSDYQNMEDEAREHFISESIMYFSSE